MLTIRIHLTGKITQGNLIIPSHLPEIRKNINFEAFFQIHFCLSRSGSKIHVLDSLD